MDSWNVVSVGADLDVVVVVVVLWCGGGGVVVWWWWCCGVVVVVLWCGGEALVMMLMRGWLRWCGCAVVSCARGVV